MSAYPLGPLSATPPLQVAEAINSRLRKAAVRVGAAPTVGLSAISSGFATLDDATGFRGFPRGRITEIIGQPTSGRETLAAHTVAAADGYSAWVDIPGLLDVADLASRGVDLARLFIVRPERATDALALTSQLLSAGHFSVVVLDAMADLARAGVTSQAVAQFIRVATPAFGHISTAALILSSPENHYRPLAHAAALRLSLVKIGLLRRGGVFRGWRTQVRILKSPGLQGGELGIEIWL